MEAAFAWLDKLMQALGSIFPRILIIRSTHAGVRFRHGSKASPLLPGLRVYWPLVTEVEVIPTARQTHNLPTQALLTSDGKKVVVSGVVVYSIVDVVATIARNWDVSDTLNDISMVAITKIVTTHTLEYLLQHLTDEVQDKLTHETRRRLRRYGVSVYWTALTDFSECLVIKNISSGGQQGTIITHNLE
jgi:regulator of protease activity HflC (stomatin/prohibitin superfamily)